MQHHQLLKKVDVRRIERSYYLALLLALLLLIVYWPALTGDFVNHDDPLYVDNPVIRSGLSWETVTFAFTSFSVAHWHPLTWLSHAAAIDLFGRNPVGHHAINLLLHFCNTLLLASILHRMTGERWRSWLAAIIFALHPLNVESVAWIAERKGVMGTFSWLLAFLFYLRYVRHPGLSRYLAVMLFMALSLLSKAMAVTLPCVLLLIDYWPLGRWRSQGETTIQERNVMLLRVVREKLPLFGLGMVSGLVAIYGMASTHVISAYSLPLRLQSIVLGYWGYLLDLFWPVNLSVYYPFITRFLPVQTALALLMLVGITLLVLLMIRRLPYLFVGWFWYLITLAPVMGLINLGQQTKPDRYCYIPAMGLFFALVWGLGDLAHRMQFPRSVQVAAVSITLATLAIVSHRQAACWSDSEALFTHAVRVDPLSSMPHNNLGVALLEKGKLDAALGEIRSALRIDPNNDDAWNNLGVAYGRAGRNNDAMEVYLLAVNINPEHASAHLNLGIAYVGHNDMQNAWKEYRILQKLRPDLASSLRPYLR